MGFRDRLERMEERMERGVENSIERLSKSYSRTPPLDDSTSNSPEHVKAWCRYGGVNGTKLMLEDVRSVEDGWLTDNVIAFWQWSLEQRDLVKAPRARIKLVRPIEAVLLARGISQNVDPDWNYTHLFLPINPSGGDVPEEGTHWSLLVVSLVDGVAFHYNSLADHPHVADEISQNLAGLIGKPLKFLDMRHVPQQTNSQDCGVFVCMFMEELLSHRLLRIDASQKISMSLRGQKLSARQGRKEILRAMHLERDSALAQDAEVLKKDRHGKWA